MPANLDIVEIKAFIPARNFALSKRFYEAIGFTMASSTDDVAYFHRGEASFLLQNFYVEQHANNFVMHLLVKNVDDWREHMRTQRIAEEFGVQIGEPEDRPWAMRDFTMTDPSGVLWRIAQNIPRQR